jgi:adenylyltransferase/sulfurtransferase
MTALPDQESPFDRQQRIPWWDQEKLARARVMVAGAGALGNEVVKNLALMGLGTLYIVDFDTIEDSNLSRAVFFRQADASGGRKAEVVAERARRLNPNRQAIVQGFHGDLVWEVGEGVYHHLDLVLGCLDNVEARLKLNEQCWKAGIPWIDGGMHALSGSVAVYDATPDRACYECGMDEDAYRRARERYSCTGQSVKSNILKGREPTTQTTSALIAAWQSQEAIKLLHGLESFAGRKVVYQGYTHNFDLPEPSALLVVQLAPNPECLCHNYESRHSDVLESEWASATTTSARELLIFARDELGYEAPQLKLERDFVVEAVCPICGLRSQLGKPMFRLTDLELACPECTIRCPRCGKQTQGIPDCPNCGQTDINERRPITLRQLSLSEKEHATLLDLPLIELGIPRLHVLQMKDDAGRSIHMELSGDLETVFEPDASVENHSTHRNVKGD